MSIGDAAGGHDGVGSPPLSRAADVTQMAVRRGMHLSIVVPIFNEEADLLRMAEELSPYLDDIAGAGRWQFVLVDNGSKDRSPELCDDIVRRWPQSVKVQIDRPDYGEALYQGLAHATGPWAFIINVDFWDVPFMRQSLVKSFAVIRTVDLYFDRLWPAANEVQSSSNRSLLRCRRARTATGRHPRCRRGKEKALRHAQQVCLFLKIGTTIGGRGAGVHPAGSGSHPPRVAAASPRPRPPPPASPNWHRLRCLRV